MSIFRDGVVSMAMSLDQLERRCESWALGKTRTGIKTSLTRAERHQWSELLAVVRTARIMADQMAGGRKDGERG